MENEITSNNYLSRLPRFIALRLSQSRWLSSKRMRPQLLRLIGIKIGKNAHVGANVTFDTLDYRLFDIGNNVTIAMNTVLLTHFLKPHEGWSSYLVHGETDNR